MFGGAFVGQSPFGGTPELETAPGLDVVPVWSLGEKTVAVSGMSGRVLEFTAGNSRTVGFTALPEKTLEFSTTGPSKTLQFTRN